MAREKTTGFYFRMSPDEEEFIRKAMAAAGFRNMSAYVRKMAANGYIVNITIPELKECSRLLRSAANNLNQIARHINSGGNMYQGEMAEVKILLDENRAQFGQILDGLAKIK
jgi:hypothetical protein